jgi:hypothetical protein
VLSLLEHGARVTLIDNLSNSFMRVLDHMKKLAGDKASLMTFVKVSPLLVTGWQQGDCRRPSSALANMA